MVNDHIVVSNMLLGEAGYLPWSCSRMEVASSCLYKFKKVYLEGMKESSPALTLGGLSHEVLAEVLKDPSPSIDKAAFTLNSLYTSYKPYDTNGIAFTEIQSFFPYMVAFSNKWRSFIDSHNIKKFFIEHPYAVTREFKRASRAKSKASDVYLRGIVDLWAYDSINKTLYVIDHKTNKSVLSSNKVKESKQLNLYVALIHATYGLEWKQAYIALNFIRKNKIVWARVTPYDVGLFVDKFMNTLSYLEEELFECENSLIYPTSKSFRCNWCTFKPSCLAYNDMV